MRISAFQQLLAGADGKETIMNANMKITLADDGSANAEPIVDDLQRAAPSK